MQNYARLADGVVAEMIAIHDGSPPLADRFHPAIVAMCVEVPDGVAASVGWTYSDGVFVAPPEPSLPDAPPPAPITARQLRLWLLSQGHALSEIDDAIAELPAEQREVARVEWEYSTEYERAHPLIASIGDALGFTDEEITAGFIAAAAI